MSNLVFFERFDGNLSAWTLDTSGGTATIVTKDLSNKLKLNDTSGSNVVSATYPFTAPTGTFIVEADVLQTGSISGLVELLDSSGTVIATVDTQSSGGTASFSTDTVGASTCAWVNATYNEVVLVVDPVGDTIRFYWYDRSGGGGTYPQKFLAEKAYSGSTIAKIRFSTKAGQTGTVYIDEVRVFSVDIGIIGDSVADGKVFWSNEPGVSYRVTSVTAGAPDENSSPSYQLGQLIGSHWAGNRGFGGATSNSVKNNIQSTIIDQGFTKCFIHVGINDIHSRVAIATLESNVSTCATTLTSGGIAASDVYIANVYGSPYFTTQAMIDDRIAFNIWVSELCVTNGYTLVDSDYYISDHPTYPNQQKTGYDAPDGIHLTPTGTGALAQALYDAMFVNIPPKTQMSII